MLCSFCSNIDLDQLAADQGYKHHGSCADLFQSVRNGCESCKLIWESQWIEIGGDLQDRGYDHGSLETQIIARAVNQKPGSYNKIRYGQEIRSGHHRSRQMTGCTLASNDPTSPFLWSFLTIATRPDDRTSNYLKLRTLPGGSSENWRLSASRWLKDCLTGHEACSPQSPVKTRPPTRVIDVGPSDGSKHPFLHISGDDVQEWVTLSYCWGQSEPLRTTIGSLSDHQQALPLNELPKLFCDAIVITRSLGYRYLWIYPLCIVQDSKEDCMREISNIGNIYKHCVFTIAAENCRDSGENILGNHVPVPTEYVQQGCYSSKEWFGNVMYASNHTKWQEGQSDHGFLSSQAWALQEHILSPRTLAWTPLQLVWSCRCTTRSEEDPTEAKPQTVSGALYYPTKLICLSRERLEVAKQGQLKHHPDVGECDPLQIWYHMVRQFCTRIITFEEDSFPAISRLAKEVKRHTGYDYRAGLWMQDYHRGLLWSIEGRALYQSTYVAPSWSWAAIERKNSMCPVCFAPSFINGTEVFVTPIAEILQTDIVYSGEDEFGPIKSGRLRINAPYRSASAFEDNEVRLPLAKDKLPNYGDDPATYKIQPSTITCWLDDRPREEEDEKDFLAVKLQLGGCGAVFVQIASLDSSHISIPDNNNYFLGKFKRALQDQNWALILEPVTGGASEWKRIGLARIADGLVGGWETRVVTII